MSESMLVSSRDPAALEVVQSAGVRIVGMFNGSDQYRVHRWDNGGFSCVTVASLDHELERPTSPQTSVSADVKACISLPLSFPEFPLGHRAIEVVIDEAHRRKSSFGSILERSVRTFTLDGNRGDLELESPVYLTRKKESSREEWFNPLKRRKSANVQVETDPAETVDDLTQFINEVLGALTLVLARQD